MNSANKRRRLNHDNAAILCKPFRSPLKVNDKQAKPSSAHDADGDKHGGPSPCELQGNQCSIDVAKSTATEQENSPLPMNKVDVVQLQREYAALCQQLRQRRQTLDILQQALTIRTSNQQEKLDRAVVKWRTIARDVADEVYSSTSAQVRDMGGLQAIKKQSQDFATGWSDVEGRPPSCGSDTINTDDRRSTEKDKHECTESEEEETDFNMAVMLRQLNIDPDLLGFDSETDDWRD